MEADRYCTAIFLDVLQARSGRKDERLFYKIKNIPSDLYAIIKFYLLRRTFIVKYGEIVIQLKEINSGIPQGSILRPMFYLLYTAIYCRSPIRSGFHNCNLFMVYNKYISVLIFTRKSLLHSEMAKKMDNQANSIK